MAYSQTTVTLLHMLKFPTRSKPTEEKYALPDLELFNPLKREFTDEENAVLVRMIRQCLYHRLLVHSMTSIYHFSPNPPRSYAATCHLSTRFIPGIYDNLFFGCAVFHVQGSYEVGREHRWKTAVNAIIRDRSNRTLQRNADINSIWTPSLGRDGWIGVYNCVHSQSGTITKAVVVWSGLDPAVYEEMMRVMYYMYDNFFTLFQAFEHLLWYRQYSIENRRRLAYDVITYGLDGLTCSSIPKSSPMVDTKECTLTAMDVVWLHKQGVRNIATIPSSYQLPSIETRNGWGEEEEDIEEEGDVPVDRYRRGFVADLDIIVDDHVEYHHDKSHFLRLSNACVMGDKVIRSTGPAGQMKIYPVDPKFDTKPWLHAFPALSTRSSTYEDDIRVSASIVTETGPWAPRWKYRVFGEELTLKCHGEGEVQTLMPVFVRCSGLESFAPTN